MHNVMAAGMSGRSHVIGGRLLGGKKSRGCSPIDHSFVYSKTARLLHTRGNVKKTTPQTFVLTGDMAAQRRGWDCFAYQRQAAVHSPLLPKAFNDKGRLSPTTSAFR